MSYLIYSPLDQMPIESDSLETIREKAKEYIGTEDWEGEIVTKLGIYRLEKVETIITPQQRTAVQETTVKPIDPDAGKAAS